MGLDLKWDWYQPTIEAEPVAIANVLMRSGLFSHLQHHETGGNGYKRRVHFHTAEGNCPVRMYFEGNPNPSVQISGEHTPELVEVIRTTYPEHAVSRADVALDMNEEGSFHRVREQLDLVTKSCGIHSGYGIVPREEEKGETHYYGSNSSVVQARLYEKAKQLLSLGRISREQFEEVQHWNRLEWQHRPNKAQDKRDFALLTPEQALGKARWERAVMDRVFAMKVDPLRSAPHVTSDLMKTVECMFDQYGATMFKWAEAIWRKKGKEPHRHATTEELLQVLTTELGPRLLNHKAWNQLRNLNVAEFLSDEYQAGV